MTKISLAEAARMADEIMRRAEDERIAAAEDSAFRDHLEYAADVVSKWPAWKRNILGTPMTDTATYPPPPEYQPMRATADAFDAAFTRVVDGDTISVDVLVRAPAKTINWPETIRVLGVDCPERGDKERWTAARMFSLDWCRDSVRLRLECLPNRDKYGRLLAWVWNEKGERLDLALRAAGLGVERLKFEMSDET